LFRDVSSYSFDNYSKELASDLNLNDLARFTERFLSLHRRQIQRKGEFVEFLLPEALKQHELPERVRQGTFDRGLAIARSDAEFLALGHPVIDGILQYAGSYDFGGLAAKRAIASERLRGKSGFLFVFVVRQRITRDDGDECLFRFEPVFVNSEGQIDAEAAGVAVNEQACGEAGEEAMPVGGVMQAAEASYAAAREHLERKAGVFDWEDDVEFVGLSWVVFS
jgi:hypothetical protein